MSDVVKAFIVGRLGSTPELKYTQNGIPVAQLLVGCNTGYSDKKKTLWFKAVAFNKTAEYVAQYANKGQQVVIDGDLDQNLWIDKEGKNRVDNSIVVRTIELIYQDKL